jgi:hypothetical protein
MSATFNAEARDYTHTIVLDYQQLAKDYGTATSATITLFKPAIGQIVEAVDYFLAQAFDGGDDNSLLLKVGDASNDDGYIESSELHVDGTEVLAKMGGGAYFTGTDSGAHTTANVVNGKVHTAAAVISAILAFGTNDTFSVLTQGKLVIGLKVRDLTRFAK